MKALDSLDLASAGTEQAPPRAATVPRAVLVTLLLASTLTIMAGATISPSLPAMARHFAGVPEADLLVRLVLTVTALAIAVCAPVAGVLVDRLGRRPVLAGAIALYAVGGGSGLLLDSLYAILAGRALLGVAVAGVMTAATSLLVDLHGGADRSRVLGLQAATMGAGGVVFLSLGGLLADLDWRGPFAIYLVALPLAALTWWVIPEPPRRVADGPSVLEAQGSGPRAVVPLVAGVCTLAFITQVIFYTVPTLLPFYLAETDHLGATEAGLSISAMVAVSAVLSWNYARIRRRLDHPHVAVASFALMAGGMTGLGLAPDATVMLPALLLTGVGVGLVMPNFSAWLGSIAPVAYRGRVLGTMVSLLFLGQFCSPLLAQPVVTSGGIDAAYLTAGALATLASLATAVGIVRPR
jgi:MFS family permease